MTTLPVLRHLDYGPSAGIADVGCAGLQAILDGYDVDAWQPILLAIQHDPWGVVADRVEQVLDHLDSDGTAAALRGWLRRCRGGTSAPAYTLSELRRSRGLTQRELAGRLEISQAQVARIEGSANPSLRSLSRYLSALGVEPIALVGTSDSGATVVRLRREPGGRV